MYFFSVCVALSASQKNILPQRDCREGTCREWTCRELTCREGTCREGTAMTPVKKIFPHYPPVNNDFKNIFPLSA